MRYATAYQCPAQHSEVLDQLLHQRNNLAKTVGYDSFAHMELKNSMVGDPNTVYVPIVCCLFRVFWGDFVVMGRLCVH